MAINKWQKQFQNRFLPVTSQKTALRILVVTFDTAKHSVVPIETLFKRFHFSVHKAALFSVVLYENKTKRSYLTT